MLWKTLDGITLTGRQGDQAVGEIWEYIREYGRDAALQEFGAERDIVELSSRYASDEDQSTGFLFSGWCQAALPHKSLANDEAWQIGSGHVRLTVQPLKKDFGNGILEHVGIPYGSRARLILYYLQTQAIETRSREVRLGGSLREWLNRMGISPGGKSLKQVQDQCDRLAHAHISFTVKRGDGGELLKNQTILEGAVFQAGARGFRLAETVCLSQPYYDALRIHPVPLETAAVRALSNNSPALDIYAWLAYRLRSVERGEPIIVPWLRIDEQFGGAIYTRPRDFRNKFKRWLRCALEVYRDARVDVTDRGITLYHSPAPVKPRVAILVDQAVLPFPKGS